jgi:UDP-GlcNAc:undecaprenyl-phosphate GlcNAc-1-phosphate transferase
MWVVYAALFASALAISAVMTFVVMKVAGWAGFVDRPSARKVHTKATPLGGGLAIAGSMGVVLAGVAAAAIYILRHPDYAGASDMARRYAGGIPLVLPHLEVAAAGALALIVMGIIDDKRGLRPLVKLSVQAAVAVLLVSHGISVTLFLPWKAAGWLATVAWMVFVTNAFNLLDNMDGLSSGVAAIIAAVFFAVAIETGQFFIAALLVTFLGSVLGFMVFNFPPAKIFMGDTGSYFLGYVLGATAVVFTFVPKAMPEEVLLPLVLPFILFAVPFYDTLSVIYIRLSEGRHIFDADKRHFSHRLADLGMNKREAVFTIYAATLATAFPALYLHHLNTYSLLGAVAQALLVLLLVAILEHAGARAKPNA